MQKSQAQENSQQRQQIICVSCKTFFGNTQTANMCSKCFKLYQGGQQLLPVLNNAIDGIKGTNSEVRNSQQLANEENKVAQQEIRQQVDKSKCYMCQRKIGVVGIQCRCGFIFCSKHRHSEDHSCTFDYGKLNQDKLKKENPLIPKQKFDKLPVLTYVNQKAGMENISKEDIQKKIYEITKNSEYYKKQKERELEQDKRIQQIQQQLELKLQDQHSVYNAQIWVEQTLNQLEQKRNFSKVWIHIDMDMFYAAVELRDQPELKDQPVAVGDKSMVSTSNYVARKHGVRSAMPGFIALKLCPQLVLIPPNFQKYKTVATSIREIFKLYDPDYESGGLDEVYLDITNFLVQNENYTPESVAQEIRKKVFEKENLTCSAGIACNKMLAKICTDVKKPNDQFQLPFDATEIKKFIGQLDIRKIPGIGGVSQRELNGLSIFKCEDIISNAYKLFIAFKNDKYVK